MAKLHPHLSRLRQHINELYPERSKRSDGWIGDARHARTESDHNPDDYGMVNALDITYDEDDGPDLDKVAERIREVEPPLIKYVIWNRRGFSSYKKGRTKPYGWRKWKGHTNHMHISLFPEANHESVAKLLSCVPGHATGFARPAAAKKKEGLEVRAQMVVARYGDRDDKSLNGYGMVAGLQRLLSGHAELIGEMGNGPRLVEDGIYGAKTRAAARIALKSDGEQVTLDQYLTMLSLEAVPLITLLPAG